MIRTQAMEEYAAALKEGQREYRECVQRGWNTNLAVLDDILDPDLPHVCVEVGVVNIPMGRIVGTKTAGRTSAFTPQFRPLLDADSEFAMKWVSLCMAHLGDAGIRDPIECYEYLGNFYVQEGNKRVSVLRHFGAVQIVGNVKRIMPVKEDTPRYKAYLEFLEFYKLTGIYDIQFHTPGSYGKLLASLGCSTDQVWSEEDQRRFRAHYCYFTQAMDAVAGKKLQAQYEDALLLWLQIHPFSDLKNLTAAELKKTITQLWPNLLVAFDPEPVVKTEPPEEKNVFVQILKGVDHLNVAFIHQRTALTSHWTQTHESGRKYLEKAMAATVTTRVYQNANTPELAEALIDQAVAEGADVVFTTAPPLIGPSLRGSVKYPKVRFLNCSIYQNYASVRTYYSRIYEGKFITGAIAGAMSKDGRIGYVESYPIRGVPTAINAFALGAQMTNPNAKLELKWSCVPGDSTQDLLAKGIRVISNRDTPVENHMVREFGTYIADEDGQLQSLGSPYWVWGQFYENVVRSIMNGSWEEEKTGQIVNLWWGMDSGVIDVALSPNLPEGVRVLAQMLREGIKSGRLDPFARKIIDQQGNVRNDGSKTFSAQELLQMDWLCENVEGGFPRYEDIRPNAKPMVDLLGVRHSMNGAGGL